MNGPAWNHRRLEANGIGIHYVRHGVGPPLMVVHGWPEFWYTWRKNTPILAGEFDVVAPDLRGFGDTDKPGLPDPPKELLGNFVEDLRGLADALGFERFGVVSHDVGAYVAQGFARKYPERLSGLFFFDCPYPGIGRRWASPDSINEIWYQTFNQQPWAASLVGENRKTCEAYIRHFLDHWAHAPGVFYEDLDLWVDNFMKPGNLQGGFDWYISTNESRLDLIRNGPPDLPKVETPTRIRWGENFAHYERPDLANREISGFFRAIA